MISHKNRIFEELGRGFGDIVDKKNEKDPRCWMDRKTGEQILDFLVKQSEDLFILLILMQMFSSVFLCTLCKYA